MAQERFEDYFNAGNVVECNFTAEESGMARMFLAGFAPGFLKHTATMNDSRDTILYKASAPTLQQIVNALKYSTVNCGELEERLDRRRRWYEDAPRNRSLRDSTEGQAM